MSNAAGRRVTHIVFYTLGADQASIHRVYNARSAGTGSRNAATEACAASDGKREKEKKKEKERCKHVRRSDDVLRHMNYRLFGRLGF